MSGVGSITAFMHRVRVGVDGKFFTLEDTVLPALERAAAIADLLEMVGCVDGIGHQTVAYVGEAIRMEILDAKALLEAFQSQQHPPQTVNELKQGADS